MASVIMFGVQHRFWLMLGRVVGYLKVTTNDYSSIMHVIKQRYDEMQILLRVANIPYGLPPTWAKLKAEKVRAKLLQVTTFHSCLLRVNGRHLIIEGSMPTSIKPLENTHPECIADALVDQSGDSELANNEFKDHTRMSIADNHASNSVAYMLLWMRWEVYVMLRWLCLVHIGHKISELQWSVFPGDLKGLMASTMAFHGPSSLAR